MWKTYWIGLMAIATGAPVCGQWQLIDDFQQWEGGEIFTDATDIGWNAVSTRQTEEYWMLADPQDADNTTLFVEAGGYGVAYSMVFVMKALPSDGIAPGETGVLFFRGYWAGEHNVWIMGTADKDLEFDSITGLQTTPGAYGDFNAQIRVGQDAVVGTGAERFLKHRDGDEYVSTNPKVIIEDYKWYKFWIVVSNTWDDSVTPPVSTGGFTVYMQGPDDPEPRLIPVGTDPAKDQASFRRAPVDADGNPQSIKWIMFNTSPGNTGSLGDPTLLDDFYFIKISGWGYTPWLRNPTVLYGDVDTGGLLGWINVDRSPFIFSYNLGGWFYAPELDLEKPGFWGYFYK